MNLKKLVGINTEEDMEDTNSKVKLTENIDYGAFLNESVEIILAKLQDTCAATTWGEARQYDKVTLYKGSVKDSSWAILKAETTIHASCEDILTLLNDSSRMPEIDEMVSHCDVVKTIDASKSLKLQHIYAKPVFPTTARDFTVVTGMHRMDDGSVLFCTRSTDVIEKDAQYVRATIIISGYVIKPCANNTCNLTVIVHTDLGGHIPATIINMVSTSAPLKLMNNIRNICNKK